MKKRYFLIVAMIIIFAILLQISLSKYVIQRKDTHAQESTAMYFESEMADIDGKQYKIDGWDGTNTQTIEFNIKNYLNTLLQTDKEITYTIKAQIIDDTSDSLNDANLIETTIYNEDKVAISESQELVLSNSGLNQEKYTLSIEPKTNLADGKEFNIELTISSIKPYVKNLKANITLVVRTNNNEVNLIDSTNGEYTVLNLKINNVNEDITIQYDNTKLILDKSNYLVNDVIVTTNSNISSFIIDKTKIEKNKR